MIRIIPPFQIDLLKLYLVVISTSILVSILSKEILITEDVIVYSFSNQLSTASAKNVFNTFDKYSWLAVIIIPFTLTIKVILVSSVIYGGFIIKNLFYDVQFSNITRAVLTAEFIIIAGNILKLLSFYISEKPYTIQELNYYYPFSLNSIVKISNVESPWIFPLSILNLFQLTYIIFLSVGLRKYCSLNKSESEKIILISYFPAFVLWILLIMFISN